MLELVPLLTFGLNIVIVIISAAGFIKIIKNDLTHVQDSLTRIEKSIEKLWDKVDTSSERISKLEGACSVAFKQIKRKKKK